MAAKSTTAGTPLKNKKCQKSNVLKLANQNCNLFTKILKKSRNIQNAISSANLLGVGVILWMGNFEIDIDGIEIWKVPSTSTPRIQETHLMWGHILAECVEEILNHKNS
jgi:hypothetical protein